MRVFHLVAAAALLAAEAPAAAEKWYRVGGDDNVAAYVDADSIRTEGGIRYGRVYTVYAEPLDGFLHAAAILQLFDCAGNYFQTIEYSFYGEGNAHLATEASATRDERRTPDPESFNEFFFRFVCQGTGGVEVADAWSDAQGRLRKR